VDRGRIQSPCRPPSNPPCKPDPQKLVSLDFKDREMGEKRKDWPIQLTMRQVQ
jgi:hypothetical protein